MNNPSPHNCVQPQTSNPFHPLRNDPYERTHSDDSIDLGLEIGLGFDPKTNPDNDNPTEKITTFTEPRNGPLMQAI